jgi:hypothetical protein
MQVVELPPARRMLKFRWDRQDSDYIKKKVAVVPLPYMYFIATHFDEEWNEGCLLQVGISNTPIKSDSDRLYFPPLGNVHSRSFRVCMEISSNKAGEFDYIADFFNSSFEYEARPSPDWTGNWVRRRMLGNVKAWSNKTPTSICEVNWPLYSTLGILKKTNRGNNAPFPTLVGDLPKAEMNRLQEILSWYDGDA